MNQGKLYVVQELLVTQLNNLIFYPAALTMVTLLSAFIPPIRTSMILWMLCSIFLTVLYPARCHIKKFLPFAAVHLAVIGIIVLLCSFYRFVPLPLFQSLDNAVNRYGMLLLIVAFSIYSVCLRLQGKTSSEVIPMPFAVGLSAGALYFQHFQGNREWDSYYKISLILVLALYFLYYYLSQYLDFLTVNANSAGTFPEKQIFKSGMRLTFFYTLLGTIILFITSQFSWLRSILSGFRQIISVIMRLIFHLFSFTEASEEKKQQLVLELENDTGKMTLPEGGETSIIWIVLETIVMIVIILAILFALYKLLQKVIAYMKSAMGQKMRTHEETISGFRDVREKCDTLNTGKSKPKLSELFHFSDPKERIRRIYKKKVSAYEPEKLMFTTAKEMEQEMQAMPFSKIYEKARYSNEICTSQDIKRMKELCR